MNNNAKLSPLIKTDEMLRSKFIGFFQSLVRILEKIINPINGKLGLISCLVLGLMVLPVAGDVLYRIFASRSLVGVIEMQEFALVIIVFMGIAVLESKRGHIKVDMFVARFPQWVRNIIDNVIYICITELLVVVTYQIVVQASRRMDMESTALELPIYIFMGIAALGMFFLTLTVFRNFVQNTVEVIKDKKTPWLLISLLAGSAILYLPYYVSSISGAMSGLALGSWAILCLFIIMFLGMPIGYAMMLVGYIGLLFIRKDALAVFSVLGTAPYFSTASFTLAVLPMFMLMGKIAYESDISRDLFEAASKWLGRVPGGLAISGVAGCAGFAAICSDSLSTAATMSSVALPAMQKKNYHSGIATGSLAAGGTLGILIPPSSGFIVYSIITEESISKLFLAGIIPGVLLALLFIAYIYIFAKRRPDLVPQGEIYSWREKFSSLKGVLAMVILIVLVLGGILSGYFSPNEGGAVGVVGALVIALVRRRMTMEKLMRSLRETSAVVASLFMIFIGVGVLGYFLSATRLPMLLADFVTGFDVNRYMILLAVIVLYIILGALMNVIPMIMLTLPAIFPTILALGFDPIWFGVVIVILMEMGQITPPVGIAVFTISSISGVPMETVFKGVMPFLLLMALLIFILIVFPQITLYLPNLM